MKPAYEHVEFGENCSVRVYHRRLPRIPFEWHHHPEYELTLTLNSHGKRYIGDSVADYVDEDLVLVPPNLPHTWASNRSIDPASPQVAIVIWFGGDWARRLWRMCARNMRLYVTCCAGPRAGWHSSPPAGGCDARPARQSAFERRARTPCCLPRMSCARSPTRRASRSLRRPRLATGQRALGPRTGTYQPCALDDRLTLCRTAASIRTL